MPHATVLTIDLPHGTDHFAAELISAKCAAEGIRHELMHASTFNTYSLLDGDPHRLVISPDDLDRVRSIVTASTPPVSAPLRATSSDRLMAVALSVCILGPLVVAAAVKLVGLIF